LGGDDEMNARWRVAPLTLNDVEGVTRVQMSAYEPRYHESAASFRAKLSAGVGSCFGVFDPELVAYLVALPCHPGFVMPLDAAPTGHVPLAEATCLYLHDLAVAASHRGRGLGDVLWNELLVVARRHGIMTVELVSVQDSVEWWQARGFTVSGDAEGGYGPEAVRMAAQIA
jgi:GNAT superfamily N-acetyltransferase